ncbi:MAG: hypothetical protein AABW99_05360 [archaeon]
MYGRKKIKVFEHVLGDSGNDVLHGRLEFNEGRKLRRFSLNLTTMSESSMKTEIARFDCAHGHLHMHRFYRKPATTEKIDLEISVETVEKLISQIKQNRNAWKKALMENYGGIE